MSALRTASGITGAAGAIPVLGRLCRAAARRGFRGRAGSGACPRLCARLGKGGSCSLLLDMMRAGQRQAVCRGASRARGAPLCLRAHRPAFSPARRADGDPRGQGRVEATACGPPGAVRERRRSCGSKPSMRRKAITTVDAAVVYHPQMQNTVTPNAISAPTGPASSPFTATAPRPGSKSRAADPRCRPRRARAHGAADACAVYTTTKSTRGDVPPAGADAERFIMHGGDATSDNLAPRFTQIQIPGARVAGEGAAVRECADEPCAPAAARPACTAHWVWVPKTRSACPTRCDDGAGEPAGDRPQPMRGARPSRG